MPISGPVLLFTALAATGASAAISAISARQQGKTASAIAEANIEEGKREQKRLEIAGREEQRRILEERRRVLARNRAKFGKAGVTMEGSPLLAQQEVARNITIDARTAQFNIQNRIETVRFQSQISKLKGRSALSASRLQVGQALFSGATQIAGLKLAEKQAKVT